MARIYANENFPLPVVEELCRLGHDVLTTLDAGQAGQAMPDEVVLQFAVSQERILITLNRKHFIRFHEQVPTHAGIVVCTVDPDFVGQARRIDEALRCEGDMHGQLLRVNRPA